MGQIWPNLASEATKSGHDFAPSIWPPFVLGHCFFGSSEDLVTVKHRAPQSHSGFCPYRTDSVVRPFTLVICWPGFRDEGKIHLKSLALRQARIVAIGVGMASAERRGPHPDARVHGSDSEG
jgi:hypothetical protein